MSPEVRRLLQNLSPVIDDNPPTDAELAVMDAMWRESGAVVPDILKAKVINAR